MQFILQLLHGTAGSTQRILCLLPLLLRTDSVLLQAFQLTGTGKNSAALGAAAAGHGTAGMDHLAIQRHNTQTVAVTPRHPDGVGEPLGNDRTPKQIQNNLLVCRVICHQFRCNPHKAGIAHRSILHEAAADGFQRKEGRASGILALQQFDGQFPVVLRVGHNILPGTAECRLNRQGELPVGMHQSGNRAMDAFQDPAVGFTHDGFDGSGVALVIALHVREHSDTRVHAVQFDFCRVQRIGLTADQVFPACEFHAASCQHIFSGFQLFTERDSLFSDFLKTCFATLDLRTDLVNPAALLLQILEDPFRLCKTAFNIGVQHCRFRFAGGKPSLRL